MRTVNPISILTYSIQAATNVLINVLGPLHNNDNILSYTWLKTRSNITYYSALLHKKYKLIKALYRNCASNAYAHVSNASTNLKINQNGININYLETLSNTITLSSSLNYLMN